jgi:hypothetical protein
MPSLELFLYCLQVLGPYTFRIGDTSGYGAYTKGGIATQVLMPYKTLNSHLRS